MAPTEGEVRKVFPNRPPAVPAVMAGPLKPRPIDKLADPAPPPGNFHLRVVEYLCWDAYDEEAQLFHPGDKHNKPIPDKKFRIRLPDDSIVEMNTDSAGEIELSAKNELKHLDHLAGEFHVLFEPEEAKLNNSYALFDELKRPLEKVPNSKDSNHG